MRYDYLIIGQGLAGSVLAYQLLKRGKRIVIMDECASTSSSRVAAGLVNPFTGPRMVKSWRAEILFPYLEKFYRELESETGASFFQARELYRPFGSVEELNDWYGRSAQPNYQKFIRNLRESNYNQDSVYDPHGGVEISAFVLNAPLFIQTMKSYLESRGTYLEEEFLEDKLAIQPDSFVYKGISTEKIIFCNGYKAMHSKFFGWIPLAPVKGEILLVELEKDFQTIYNKSGFIIPQGKRRYKIGSTYNRNDLTEKPTDSGKNEICEKLESLSPMNYKIVGQQAGIRPGTVPRRPLIGEHPRWRNMFVFNGLGTKGVSLAPYFSNELVNCLEDGNNLDQEVNIKKYYSLYFNSQFDKES